MHALLIAEGLRLLLRTIKGPLLYLVDHIADQPLLVIANARPHESNIVDDLLREWERRAAARILHLAPFARSEVDWPLAVAGELDAAAEAFARSLSVLDALPYPTPTAPWYEGAVVLAT